MSIHEEEINLYSVLTECLQHDWSLSEANPTPNCPGLGSGVLEGETVTTPLPVLESIRMPTGIWDIFGSNRHMAWISHFYWHGVIIFTESSALLQIVNDKVRRIRDQLKIIEGICCSFY